VDFRFESTISGLNPPPTPPLMRTLADGIDASKAASGIILVSLNSNTEGVARAIYDKDNIRAFFEIRGFDGNDKCIYDYRWRVSLLGAIDPQGGEPIPIESGGVTLTDVYAVANGAVAAAGHVTSAQLSATLLDYALLSSLDEKQDLITSSAMLDYALISGTPTIPTVNDPTITFVQGGVTKGTITLNQSTSQTITFDAGGGGGVDPSVLSAYTPLSTTNTLSTSLTAHTSNANIHVTAAEKALWNTVSGLVPVVEGTAASGGTGDFAALNGNWTESQTYHTYLDNITWSVYTKTVGNQTYYLEYLYSNFQSSNLWVVLTYYETEYTNWTPNVSEASVCYASTSTWDFWDATFYAGNNYSGTPIDFYYADGGGGSYAPLSAIQYQVKGKQSGTLTSGIFIDIVTSLPVSPDNNTLYFIQGQ